MPSSTDFFPPRAFASLEYDGADSRKANSEFLRLMSEPSLWCGQALDEGYRVLNYFPFWGPPHPVAVRLTRTGAGLDLVAVSLAGGRDTGVGLSVGNRIQKSLGMAEFTAFASTVETAGFWTAPNVPPQGSAIVLDADVWILEGRRGGLYRLLPFSPSQRSSFTPMLKMFFGMSGLEVPSELAK